MKKIAVIPIDNRPICYTLLEQICAIDNNIKLHLPPRDFLGGLTEPANVEEILAWLKNLPEVDNLIISLDTIAYGGLVSSRRSPEDYQKIAQRLELFKGVVKNKAEKVLAFSSIMRISNNNINEEEKEYWNPWGTRIFEYSYYLHKSEVMQSANCVYNKVPSEILEDYIKTRERNFNINKIYLDWLDENILDYLVYSKDDSGEYGLNIKEARELSRMINERDLSASVRTGADEIPLGLLSRALSETKEIKLAPVYLENAKNSLSAISKYEDVSVTDCVSGQLKLAGVEAAALENADVVMFVNNFQTEQGDLVLGDRVNFIRQDVFRKFKKMLKLMKKPYCIADINNANGADSNFIYYFLQSLPDKDFYGYAGYNTSANTIGCAICTAVVKYLAVSYNENAFKKLQFIRLMDDWAYQANVRKGVREAGPDFKDGLEKSKGKLSGFEKRTGEVLGISFNDVQYSLPWNRSFEIEIKVN